MKKLAGLLLPLTVCIGAIGCAVEPSNQSNTNPSGSATPVATASASPVTERASNEQPLTLPVLDAFFADESFPAVLKSRLQLSDQQVTQLRELAHSETAKLSEDNAGATSGETAAAREMAVEKVRALVGDEKAKQLAALVRERWGEGGEGDSPKAAGGSTNPTTPADFAAMAPNAVPTDSRIVVNAPAFRMDVFNGGRLIKSYKIGIGYPQFPLPTALRKANSIIFNPTWTPPDEPWVAKMKNITAGEKVEAGSKLNPLGPIKIPIGLPSLIHGGKSPAKLGTFASHGCVGLTTPQVQDFARVLAQLAGSQLTDASLAGYARDKTQTKTLKLQNAVPVELRYETIVVEDGKLHIYRDVYDHGTNSEENLRAVLEANGVKFDDLTEAERAQVLDALAQLGGKSSSTVRPSPTPSASPATATDKKAAAARKAPRPAKNQKEIVIEIAALKGKGYPAPVALDTGSGKTKTVVASAKPETIPKL